MGSTLHIFSFGVDLDGNFISTTSSGLCEGDIDGFALALAKREGDGPVNLLLWLLVAEARRQKKEQEK